MRIDSHHHFWQYSSEQYPWMSESMAVLRRDYLPNELQTLIDNAKIDRVISVQARQSLEETQWLLELASQNSFIAGVVGWVPLASPTVARNLEVLATNRLLRSVRHVVQDEPDDRFLLGKDFNRGIAQLKDFGLVYDLLIFAKHFPATIEFVDRHPQQIFILDHIAKPTILIEQFDKAWSKHLIELAKRPNVSCKFSGVVTEVRHSSWTIDTIRPYWDVAWNAFGAKRMMFGSDWPVCLLKSDYHRWLESVETLTQELSLDEQSSFWGGTARSVYGLA